MINLDNITLATVSSIEIDLHVRSLRYSSQYFKFAKTKFFSDKEIKEDGIEWIKCEEMKDRLDYSFYMVNEFPKYIDTEFVLIVQGDGFIINPHKWTEIFLEYDYIGAPFPDEPQYGFTGDTRVGNGGFSLRSKKLIDMPIKLNLPGRDKSVDRWWEDNYYCVAQRETLKKHGCKFAPLEVAKHFSHEITSSDMEGIEPFGCHSKPRKEFYDFENEHKRRASLRPSYYNWPL
jgi:hypothetical protein